MGHRAKRQDFDRTVSRKHFMTTQDIHNIRRSLLDRQIKRHENDATSVDIIVQELKEEQYNPVLIYKPQGTRLQEYPNLPEKSFVLVIQTEFQQLLYRSHCSKILCIDATHKTNAYRFKLITCMVQDEFSQGNLVRERDSK